MIKNQLTSLCAGILLSEVRVKGHLTYISEESGINRKNMNRKNFRLLRFHRLVRLLYTTASWTDRERFRELGARMFETIWDFNQEYDDRFYTE